MLRIKKMIISTLEYLRVELSNILRFVCIKTALLVVWKIIRVKKNSLVNYFQLTVVLSVSPNGQNVAYHNTT